MEKFPDVFDAEDKIIDCSVTTEQGGTRALVILTVQRGTAVRSVLYTADPQGISALVEPLLTAKNSFGFQYP